MIFGIVALIVGGLIGLATLTPYAMIRPAQPSIVFDAFAFALVGLIVAVVSYFLIVALFDGVEVRAADLTKIIVFAAGYLIGLLPFRALIADPGLKLAEEF